MKAVILAGGKGSRLAPYTTVLPKPLMPIVDMPILEIVLKQLRSCGFDEIQIAVGHLAALIKSYFGDGSDFGIHIEYSLEDVPLGTAGPLGQIDGLTETFLLMNGDILTDLDFRKLVDHHLSGQCLLTVATHKRTVKIDFGVLETDGGRVTRYIEKPSLDYVVSMGVYVMEPSVREYITPGEYLDMPDLVRLLLADGKPVTGPGRERLVMFQEPALFPWLDVFGNVLFGLKLKPNLTNRDRRQVAKYYLELVGLSRFDHANIHELSGGMKQRVSLARALAPNPRVLLMDEPFAALDALTREQLYGDIQEIWKARRKTIVFVTHNVREAACLGDRVLLFAPHPGRIHEEFTVDLPRPRDINSVDLAAHATRITKALKSLGQPEAAVTG